MHHCHFFIKSKWTNSQSILERYGVQHDELPYIAGDLTIVDMVNSTWTIILLVLKVTLNAIGSMIIISIALPYTIPMLFLLGFMFGKVEKILRLDFYRSQKI